MVVSYTNASSSLNSSPAHVIFIDTCVLLDIVRSPVRESVSADSAKYAQDLYSRATNSPPSLWLVTSETVLNEWHENISSVKDETAREIRRLERRRQHLLRAVESVTKGEFYCEQNTMYSNIADQMQEVSEALLDACMIVVPDDEHSVKAMNRVKKYMPPAQRGKSEAKDCEIFELFLALCEDARAAGITDEFLFVSSNVKDYGEHNAGGIQPELSLINARFIHNIAWATAVIDGRV